jgi:hypothetical protein
MVASRKRKKNGSFVYGTYALGLIGLICLLVSGVGLWHSLDSSRDLATVIKNAAPVVSDSEVKDVDVGVEGVTPDEEMAGFDERVGDDYYPLEVGRYWVYRRQDPVSGAVTEVERRIVRRESRADRDLYFFDDGTVAYSEEGKVFEMGPEGGVNVVLASSGQSSYEYRSEGFHIEKVIGARDTVLMSNGRRYERCMQIITRFRREEDEQVLSYASYYSPGIGLIGREMWPASGSQPAEVLRDFGPQNM